MKPIPESELVLNSDGSVYHLNLLPENLADTVLLVGDPDRVPVVSKFFDRIEFKKQHRELITHTGFIGKKRLSVISTGMSTANIDIVLTELDALVNIDLKTRLIKEKLKVLNIVRLGTAGSLQAEVPMDSVVISNFALGTDGLANFYNFTPSAEEAKMNKAFQDHFEDHALFRPSYTVQGDESLIKSFSKLFTLGNTLTCGGFYGPQGRVVRLKLAPVIENFIPKLSSFRWNQERLINFEMETAGIYAMSRMLGHRACSLSTILADRTNGKFTQNGAKAVESMIEKTLELLT